jgi:hypothetical protein
MWNTDLPEKCRWKFQRRFHDERASSRQTTHNLVNKFRTIGLLIDKKQKHKHRVLSEENLDDIGARLEHTPRTSLTHRALETRVSKASAIMAIQLLWPFSESWCLVCCKCKEDCCMFLLTKQLIKGNAVPVTGCEGPRGCQRSRLPHLLDNWLTDGGKVVSLTHQLPFTPREDSWYSFLLEQCFSTAGPWDQLYRALVPQKKEFTRPRSDKG